jgi:hypothetical protein
MIKFDATSPPFFPWMGNIFIKKREWSPFSIENYPAQMMEV